MVYLAAAIVVATLVAMASGRVPPLLALATGLCAAGLTRIATFEQLASGLGNAGVVTVAGMLVIAKGVVRTGVVSRVTRHLLDTVTSSRQALRRLALPVGTASALINTTPIVAMLIPATRELEQTRQVPAREVLLPITHTTTLSGSVTLIGTSSNLLIAGIAGSAGVSMSMLSFAPVALPVAVVGTLALVLFGPRLLHGEAVCSAEEKAWRVEIPVTGRALVVGRRPSACGLEASQVFALVAVRRDGGEIEPDQVLGGGDVLVYRATRVGVAALWGNPLFGLAPQKLFAVSLTSGERGSLRDIEDDEQIRVIAAQTETSLRRTPLTPGEVCFVTATDAQAVADHPAFGVSEELAGTAPQPGKTWIALAVLVAVIVAASFGLAPVAIVASTGAVLMVLTGVLTPHAAVRALDWNVLFILAGSIGLGAVVVASGLATALASAIRHLAAGNPFLVVVVLVLTTTLLTNMVSNAAAASVLTPVVIGIAAEMQLSPTILLARLGTCISFTFLMPFSHQSNLMVMRPGGYDTATFVRLGVPLTVLVAVVAVVVGYLLVRT
ncbi:MAG: SLC13 family permease [Candidatus Nanopelagicales bacterium]